jgi:hypothetical protein
MRAMAAAGLSVSAADSMEQAIASAEAKGDLPALRTLADDLLEMSAGMPREVWSKADDQVRGETGRGLREEQGVAAERLRRLVSKGRLRNERDYRLVVSVLADVGDPSHTRELRNDLTTLLEGFERRTVRRR